MARFITLHEEGEDVYINVDQITFIHKVKYKTVDNGRIVKTQVLVAHGFVEVDETNEEVMKIIGRCQHGPARTL